MSDTDPPTPATEFDALVIEALVDHCMDTLSDAAINFLYYDRKEDEDFDRDDVEMLLESGAMTPDEMGAIFAAALKEHLGWVDTCPECGGEVDGGDLAAEGGGEGGAVN